MAMLAMAKVRRRSRVSLVSCLLRFPGTYRATGQSNRIIGIVTDANSYRTMCATTKTDDAQGGIRPCILPAGVQSIFKTVRNIEQAGYGSHLVRGILF